MRRINPESDLFPCFTRLIGIPWSIFSTLDHIPRSDEARQSGWLREYDPASHDVIFVSHNWWTRPANVQPGVYDVGAPDILEGPDRNLKHRVVCSGTRKLIDGVPAQQGVTRIDGLDEEFPWSIPAIPSPFRSGKEVLMWVDWFSIDQDDRQVKLAGVMSLIHYATLSTAMLIPCRDEAIEAAYPENLPLYGTRGWCRAVSPPRLEPRPLHPPPMRRRSAESALRRRSTSSSLSRPSWRARGRARRSTRRGSWRAPSSSRRRAAAS